MLLSENEYRKKEAVPVKTGAVFCIVPISVKNLYNTFVKK